MEYYVKKQVLNLQDPNSYSILMAIDQPVLVFSKRHKLLAINEKGCTTLGIAKKTCKNTSYTDIISKSGYRLEQFPAKISFKHGFKFRVFNKSHQGFLGIEFKCIEAISNNQQTSGYILLGSLIENNTHNLSSNKSARNQKHISELDAIPCGIFIKNLKGKVTDCNTTMTKMLGLNSTSELMNLDSYVLAATGKEKVKSNDEEIIKTQKIMMFEEEVTLQNGKKHCFQSIKAPYYNKKNQLIGIIGISIDITRKKNNELLLNKKLKQLKQESIKSYNYLDRIIASIPCNVWWTNKKHVVIGGNNRVAQFLGLKSRDELIGLTYEQVGKLKNSPRKLRKSYEDDIEVMRTGIPKENVPEAPLPGPDGENIYYITTRTPLIDENGKIAGVIGTSWDISNRVIIEKKLMAAQKKIEASSRSKDEFLATVSHELRTPLNGILGMADILSRQNLPTKEAAMVNDITKSGGILLSLIDDLLDITKMDLHEIKINPGKLNLQEAINDVINHLTPQMEKKLLTFDFTYSQQLPEYIKSDTQRIKQILFNIIGNAIKFTNTGKIYVSVKPKRKNKYSKFLELIIKDTGVGIPSDKLEYIFDRFAQVRTDSTKHILGAGLGLSIAKSLITLMGGKITVKSRVNHGSTFIIDLPYEPINENHDRDQLHSINNAKILVIDDDISSGEQILKKLQPHNAQLVSSDSAIKIISSNYQLNTSFDIILLSTKSISNTIKQLVHQIKNEFRHLNLVIILCNDTLDNNLRIFASETGISLLIKTSEMKPAFTRIIHSAWEKSLEEKQSSKEISLAIPARVLLVEDNIINQKIAVHLLSELNCHVDTSPNGTTAIELFNKNSYDIVLLDIGLPDLDGTIVSKAMRKNLEYGDVPIIAMTAYASENDRDRCLNSGINDVITKPVDLKSLRAILSRWFMQKVT